MNVLKVADVLGREIDEVIPAMCGTVKRVYKRQSGTSTKGPWSVQNVVLTSGASEITVSCWGREEMTEGAMKGRVLYIEAAKNAKGQWSGVKVEEHDYEGKKSKRVKVGESATLTLHDADTASASAPAPAPTSAPAPVPTAAPAPAPAPQTTSPAQAPAPQQPPHTESGELRFCVAASKAVGQMGNAMKICLARAAAVCAWHDQMNGHVRDGAEDNEHVYAIATTFFIQGQRDGVFVNLPNTKDISTLLKSLNPEANQP